MWGSAGLEPPGVIVPEPSLSLGMRKGEGSLDLCLSRGVGLIFLSGVLALTDSMSRSWKSLSSNLNNKSDFRIDKTMVKVKI